MPTTSDAAKAAGLNDRQYRFALEYCNDYNGTQAAIRAGYSPHTAAEQAYDLLKKPQIRAVVAEHGQQTADELGITLGKLLTRLDEVASKALRGAQKSTVTGTLVFDADGEPIMEWNPAGVNRAIELLMKHRGDLIERLDVSGSLTVTLNGIDVEDLK